MEIKRALEIITMLTQGVDPYTGEIFSDDSPYQNAETVRALILAQKGLERLEKHKKRIQNLPKNAGKPWSNQEDEALLNKFDSGETIKELAKEHQRTEGSIRSRLARFDKITIRN